MLLINIMELDYQNQQINYFYLQIIVLFTTVQIAHHINQENLILNMEKQVINHKILKLNMFIC